MDEEELNRRKTICALHGLRYGVDPDDHWVERSAPGGGHRALAIGRRSGSLWAVRSGAGLVGVRNIEEVIEHLTKQN